jgi:TRAP-type transport system small permease protein
MQQIEHGIALLCKALLWVSTTIIFLILVANTILRYATGSSLQWANEVPELLFPWLVMSGVVLAALHGAHITTSFLAEKLSPAARKWMSFAAWLVVAGLYSTLAWATWKMLSIVHDEKSPILQIPGSWTYGCVMVGMVLLAFLAFGSAWKAYAAPPSDYTQSSEPVNVHW